MNIQRVAFFTSTRADYGLLHPLMSEIAARPGLELQIIASGTHLSAEYGMALQEIEADGFKIDEAVDMCLAGDGAIERSKSAALAMMGTAEALARLISDMLVLLGDRYEILAAAQDAVLARIPIVHIHGGETTEGAIDELIRGMLSLSSHIYILVQQSPIRSVYVRWAKYLSASGLWVRWRLITLQQ